MEFYIHSDRYFLKEHEDRSFFMMVLGTNQPLNFDKALHPLLKATDRWVDFSSFVQLLEMTNFLKRNISRLLEDAVLSLHAAGIAEVKDMPCYGGTGIRWAKQRDYYALSDFCSENFNQSKSCTVSFGKQFFSYRAVYDGLKSGDQYVLLKEKDGHILAAAVFGFSSRFFGSRVLELKSLIFDQNEDEQACREDISELAAFARESLKQKVSKLRYESIHPRQAFIVDALKAAGFEETACFKEELKNGRDLILLDLMEPSIES